MQQQYHGRSDRARLAAATGQLFGTLHVEGEIPLEFQYMALDAQGIAARLTALPMWYVLRLEVVEAS